LEEEQVAMAKYGEIGNKLKTSVSSPVYKNGRRRKLAVKNYK
jgi:hypothetical protein